MAKTLIYPAAVEYLSKLSSTIASLTNLGIDFDKDSANKIADLTNSMIKATNKLSSAMEKQDELTTIEEKMNYSARTICPLMKEVREYADALEGEVADSFWPLPTYQEMLFIK
jgi:glutamine synthetase